MQQLLDYAAILAFVVVYFISRDIFLATGVLMVGVATQVALYWLLKKPIGNELKITFWASMVLGGMTLILRNEAFIQWKPTIVNAVLASVLLFGHLVKRTFFVKKMMGKILDLPDHAWLVLTYIWVVAFTIAGVANIWVAYNYSMDTWVTFKFVGLMGINIVFLIITFAYLGKKGYLSEDHFIDPNSDKTDEQKNEKASEA